MNPIRLLLISVIFFATAGGLYSRFHKERVVVRSVYNWNSDLQIDPYNEDAETEFANRHGIRTVYIKMVDVGWNEGTGIFRNSSTSIPYSLDTSFQYIPVAFIENKVFNHIDSAQTDLLCINVMRHLLKIEQNEYVIQEFQIDCDWTESTKNNYFRFLRRMKVLRPEYIISATIRLYQHKYPSKAGVPPVDKGMLMAYNIGNAARLSTENSIFDKDRAEEYYTKKRYPLKLDIALPAFSWALFYRQNKLLGVRGNVSVASCDSLSFLSRTGKGNLFRVNKDTVWEGSFLRYGDLVKPENCYDRELTDAAEFARSFCNQDTVRVALFDLDMYDLNHIKHESIEKAYTAFR